MEMFSLAGKTAVVTGASRGLGQGMALDLPKRVLTSLVQELAI